MERAAAQVVEGIAARSQAVEGDAIRQVATVSAGNDEEIGRMIAEAMDKVSADGVITVEESTSLATELEITECAANESLRIVTDSHGTIWDSRFALEEVDGGTRLTLTIDAKAHQLVARLMNPMVMPAVRSAVADDLDLVKAYCESAGEREA